MIATKSGRAVEFDDTAVRREALKIDFLVKVRSEDGILVERSMGRSLSDADDNYRRAA